MRSIFLCLGLVALAFATVANATECSAEKHGVKLRHKVETTKTGTEASCAAGKHRGGSSAPSGVPHHETGLCKAGDWTFVYKPDTKVGTATYDGTKPPPRTGTRVELKCTTTAA